MTRWMVWAAAALFLAPHAHAAQVLSRSLRVADEQRALAASGSDHFAGSIDWLRWSEMEPAPSMDSSFLALGAQAYTCPLWQPRSTESDLAWDFNADDGRQDYDY